MCVFVCKCVSECVSNITQFFLIKTHARMHAHPPLPLPPALSADAAAAAAAIKGEVTDEEGNCVGVCECV